jgi:dihydrofolate reductase
MIPGIPVEERNMRRLVLYMTQTLDGYLAGADGGLDWMTFPPDDQQDRDVVELLNAADIRLMGYPTAPGMVEYWDRVAENPDSPQWERDIAEAFNPLHTVAVSRSEEDLHVRDSELLLARDDDELTTAVEDLKSRPGKDIVLIGGVRSGQTFARLGLVDEYVLMVHPTAIGEGKRLFTQRTPLELVCAKPYGNGVVQLRYRPRTNG